MCAPRPWGVRAARGVCVAAGLRGGEYEARSHLASFQPPDDGRGTRAGAVRAAAFGEPIDHHQFALLSLSADILATVATAETIDPACETICLRLRTFFSADHVVLGLVNLEHRSREIFGFTSSVVDVGGISSELAEADIVAYRDAIEGRAQAFPDLGTTVLNPGTEVARQAGLQSLIRAPFRLSDGSVGLVSVASATRGQLGEHEAADLLALCTPIGLAVDRVRLLAAANERQANATAVATMLSTLNVAASPEKAAVEPVALAIARVQELRIATLRAANLEAINHVLTLLGEGGSPDDMAAGFLAECRALFECQLAAVVTFDYETGQAQRLALDSSIFGPDDLPRSLPIDDDAGGQPGRVPDLIDDLEAVPNPGSVRKLFIANGLRSGIRVPLIVHDTVIGAVSLWSTDVRRYDADDVAMLSTLTRPLALALGRANALNSLAESELKFRSLIAQAEEMIFLFDSTTLRIVDANAYTERALGYSRAELLALHVDQLVNADREDVLRNVRTTVQQGELHLAERVYRRKDGSLMEVDVVASPVIYGGRATVLALVRDVSERRSFQAQLVQGQKMESLGLMAGNLAHDFNNLLTTILGFAGLLKRSTNLDGEERENLGLIEAAARSAADLTGRLLSFARGGLVKFGPVDLRLVVEDTLRIAGPSLHGALTVTTTFGPNSASIEGDGGQVQQALLNIVLNAKDAMPEGGSIAISLTADETTAQLIISDNGPGMTEETRRRIFEPFYTTKPLGSGTGLGMAITYGIIQGHHGDISVESRLGKGTTFTITLPLFDPGVAQIGGSYDPGEGNLILVVDDDEMVRRTTSATLAALGYNVVEAPGGATAVQVVKARPDRIAAVLLDLVMPGMTGSETFRALTELRPDLPVIVCTGYAADAHIDTDVQRRIAGLVQKPFTAERLGQALSDAGVTPTRR